VLLAAFVVQPHPLHTVPGHPQHPEDSQHGPERQRAQKLPQPEGGQSLAELRLEYGFRLGGAGGNFEF
jgi:hypothetical protein